jgi:hypothetical protein
MTVLSPISRALHYAGTHQPEDVAEGVASGRFQEWTGGETVVVTEILVTPLRKTLHFFLAEGNLVEIEAMLGAIMSWGASIGCTHASLVGRHGWSRSFLTRLGWKQTGILMEVPIHGVQRQAAEAGERKSVAVGESREGPGDAEALSR